MKGTEVTLNTAFTAPKEARFKVTQEKVWVMFTCRGEFDS